MGYNVLVADDILVNRKLIKAVINKNIKDVNIYDAEDGYQAVQNIVEKEIDLVILDLMMPGMDGFDVLEKIKEMDEVKDIPIIVNSALDDIDSIKRALEAGAWDYFTKPLSPDEIDIVLPLKIKNALKSYEQHKLLTKMNKQMNDEMQIANAFQHSLIINEKKFAHAQMYGKYVPWIEIGGDLYDCVEVGDTVWFIMADVTGHGVAAAMVSTMIKVVFNDCVKSCTSPKEVIENMNRTFLNMSNDGDFYMMFTAFVGMIKDEVLTFCNAGHPFPLIFNTSDKTVSMIGHNSTLIGIFEDANFKDESIVISKDNVLMVYTDGLFNIGEDSEESLKWTDVYNYCFNYKDELIASLSKNPMEFIDTTMVLFSENCRFNDDVAIMVVRMI